MSTSQGQLGLSLKLPTEAVEAFKQKGEKVAQNEEQEPVNVSVEDPLENEEWNETLSVQPGYLEDVGSLLDVPPPEEEEEEDGDSDDDDDDISLGPPPSLPVVVVKLERFCGFFPSEETEVEQLRQDILQALSEDNDGDETTNKDKDSLSRHFEQRVSEMLETGVAVHGDTSCSNAQTSTVVINYPEFLCRSDRPEVLVTAKEWKRLLRPHKIPVVHRLLSHLRRCNRPLSWKVDMRQELWHLAKTEERERRRQLQKEDLHCWRTERRSQQLDQLYQVRETFDQRLEEAQDKLERLEEERDAAVSAKLRQLHGGLQALDFETNTFAFNDDDHDETKLLEYSNDDEHVISDASEHSESYDSDSDGEYADVESEGEHDTNEVAAAELAPVGSKESRGRRRQKVAKMRRQRQSAEASAAAEQERIEKASAEQERVRELCTTTELRMAQALVKTLEGRMKQVDDLLETLQEEEWADEEAGFVGEESSPDTESPQGLSLLDCILAMVLGSLPQNEHVDTQEHYSLIQQEHQTILDEWKDYFGRLPVLQSQHQPVAPDEHPQSNTPEKDGAVAASSAASLRQSLGIVENDAQDNWDDVEDWDKLPPATNKVPSEKVEKKPAMGLRPGGRAAPQGKS